MIAISFFYFYKMTHLKVAYLELKNDNDIFDHSLYESNILYIVLFNGFYTFLYKDNESIISIPLPIFVQQFIIESDIQDKITHKIDEIKELNEKTVKSITDALLKFSTQIGKDMALLNNNFKQESGTINQDAIIKMMSVAKAGKVDAELIKSLNLK